MKKYVVFKQAYSDHTGVFCVLRKGRLTPPSIPVRSLWIQIGQVPAFEVIASHMRQASTDEIKQNHRIDLKPLCDEREINFDEASMLARMDLEF